MPDVADERKLVYPLRHPLNTGSNTGSDTISDPQLAWDTTDPNERVNIVLNLSFDEFKQLASSIDVGRDIAYGEDSTLIWWIWSRAFGGTSTPTIVVTETTVTQKFYNAMLGDNGNMPNSSVVFYNGQPYLQVDCGCADSLFIPLSTPAQIGLDGNPVSSNDGAEFGGGFSNGTGGASGVWGGSVGSTNQSCYAAAATAYLLQRAQEFFYAVIDWYIIGTSVETAENLKYIDFGQLAPFLAFGSKAIDYIRNIGRGAVDLVLADTALAASLEAAWTYTGSVNRQQLKEWIIQGCPPTVAGYSASVMLLTWTDYSIIPAYNQDLVQLAANCESGYTSGIGFSYTWARAYPFLADTNTFIVGGGTDAVWADGFGFGAGAASGNWAIEIHKDMTGIVVTGFQIKLSRAMDGAQNEVRINTGEDNSGNLQDTTGLTDEIITLALSHTFAGQMYFFVNENSSGSGLFDAYIEEITLFGTGTPADGGTVIAG